MRYRADLVVPGRTLLEMAVLKGIAAHYVMQADDRVAAMSRQRELLAALVGPAGAPGAERAGPPVRRRLARGRRRRRHGCGS